MRCLCARFQHGREQYGHWRVCAQYGDFGDNNTATGHLLQAPVKFTTRENNTATGAFALLSNNTGSENTAIGVEALSSNTTASNNTAIGSRCTHLHHRSDNLASGVNALFK